MAILVAGTLGVPMPEVYQLPSGSSQEVLPGLPPPDRALGFRLLNRNILWFIQLRWIVIGILLLLALLVALRITHHLRLELGISWLLGLAGFLGLANLGFRWHAHGLQESRLAPVHVNLWGQIALDLLAVSVVVHHVGSTHTYAPFLYVIHVALACIFFGHRESLLVLVLAVTLYLGCIGLEISGVAAEHDVFAAGEHQRLPAAVLAVHVASGILLWVAIWALVSHLSSNLRQRQREVMEAQRQTLETFRQAQEHMRHTAHQMKAPLDAIRSTVSLIDSGYAGEVSPKADQLLERITARATALSAFVGDVLQLAHLKAGDRLEGHREQLDLAEVVQQSAKALQEQAQARQIHLQVTTQPSPLRGDREGLQMMVDNLLTNAITYSHPGGKVQVRCQPDLQTATVLEVSDQGIGIPPQKLPKIFDEYYRTSEAKAHNRESTGVGLAIVREVARRHDCQITVSSEPERGTSFTMTFPANNVSPQP